MINDRAKRILSEGASANEERNIVFLIVFLEEGGLSYIFRLFRAGEDAGDPEQQAIRWMGRAKGLCRSAPGELSTGMIRSKDGERFMVAVSGREIEAKEWPREFDDSSRLSTRQAATPEGPCCHVPGNHPTSGPPGSPGYSPARPPASGPRGSERTETIAKLRIPARNGGAAPSRAS